MLLTPDASTLPTAAAYMVSAEAGIDPMFHRASGFVPCGQIPVSEIEVGEARYRLRRPLQGDFVITGDGSCEFWVEGFGFWFVGHGPLADDAYNDWREQVHETFQVLHGKRPFEMDQQEAARWETLQNVIDVIGYQNETPIRVRQLGQVRSFHRGPRVITWADGSRDSVTLDQAPPEFARLRPGQPIEAITERDPVTGRLRRLRDVRPIQSFHRLSGRELTEFWNSLPGTSSLPESTRDWSDR